MTDVRTFRAASMQAALERVREEMGTDAVILHTRQVARRRLLPWRKATQEVEITAGLGVNIRPQAAAVRSSAPQFRSSKTQVRAGRSAAAKTPAAPAASQARGHRHAHEQPPSISTSRDAATPASSSFAASEGVEVAFSTVARRQADAATERLISNTRPAPAAPPPSSAPPPQSAAGENEQAIAFAEKLDSIQKMLEHLGRSNPGGRAEEIPGELFNLYTELIDAEVDDDLARELIFRLKENCTPAQLADGAASKALLTALVESEIRCCDPITPSRGKRKVVALVGATGVGKTTTIAKLAANFRLREGVSMGLVTVDTYRIAAVEQLRTYAEIIDLPMKVVTNPLEMRRALDELTGLDLVLIDTAGRSPRDELQIQELKSLLSEAHVDEVHLVLNLTASLRSLEATARKFAVANTTSMILTKLDEAAGMGTLLSVARRLSLPVSYLTTGQGVPDDIEAARPARIARLVLGQEKLS